MADGKINKCKSCSRLYQKKYIQDNHQKYLEYGRKYYDDNRESQKQQKREYYINNKDKYFKWQQEGMVKFKSNIRGLIYHSFKRNKENRYKKGKKTEEVLGCTFDHFIEHIMSLFTEGMTLDNHGKGSGFWNFDHIIPLSSAQTEEELAKLCHYTNIQPLWYEDNMRKFNHYDPNI